MQPFECRLWRNPRRTVAGESAELPRNKAILRGRQRPASPGAALVEVAEERRVCRGDVDRWRSNVWVGSYAVVGGEGDAQEDAEQRRN